MADVWLKNQEISATRFLACDGVEAMAFLRQEGRYANASRPDLILLDLNLPKKDGREVLKEVKLDQQLKRIPVVVLTTSSAEQDILNTYELHANCYITKPVDYENFATAIRQLGLFLSVIQVPVIEPDA